MSYFDGIKTGDEMNNIKDGKGRISYAEYLILKNKGLVLEDDILKRLEELKNDTSIEDTMKNNYEMVIHLVKRYTILTDEDIKNVSLVNVDTIVYILAALQYHINEGGLIKWTYYIIPSVFAVNVILED